MDEEGEDAQQEVALCEVFGLDVEGEDSSDWGVSSLMGDTQLIQQIQEGYSEDEYFKDIINHLQTGLANKDYVPPKELRFLVEKFIWEKEDKLLFKILENKRVLCLPKIGSLIVDRLYKAHDTPLGAHLGRDKTLANIAKKFFWPGMVKDVDEYVKSCENYQKNKGCKRSPLGLLYPHERPQKPWQKISLDFIVQLPKTKEGNYDAILTVVDAFSKRMHFIPCFSNLDALGTARLLREHVFKLHGYPMCIVSDRGSIFTSEVWKELFKLLGTRQKLSSSFHPQTDGASEKANDMIESCIRAFTNYQQDDWNVLLPDFELGLNSSKSDASGVSPQYLDTGEEPFIPTDVTFEKAENKSVKDLLDKMLGIHARASVMFAQAQEKQALYANRKRSDVEFEEGDFVLLSSDFVYDPIHTKRPARKLVSKGLGPFRIEKKVSRVAYKLFLPAGDNLKTHPVIHIANLKKYEVNPERFMDRKNLSVPDPLKDSQGETVYMVEDIINMKKLGKKRLFLIKWTGYDDLSWEPEDLLRESKDFEEHLEIYLDEIVNGTKIVLKQNKGRNMKAKPKEKGEWGVVTCDIVRIRPS